MPGCSPDWHSSHIGACQAGPQSAEAEMSPKMANSPFDPLGSRVCIAAECVITGWRQSHGPFAPLVCIRLQLSRHYTLLAIRRRDAGFIARSPHRTVRADSDEV